jgi:hypothetical protein
MAAKETLVGMSDLDSSSIRLLLLGSACGWMSPDYEAALNRVDIAIEGGVRSVDDRTSSTLPRRMN